MLYRLESKKPASFAGFFLEVKKNFVLDTLR